MRGANPLFLAAALRNRQQRSPMDFGPVASLASEQAFLDERGRQTQSMDRQFNTPVFGGEIAPIVGLLRGLSKVAQRRQGDAKLEDLRADWEADTASVRAQEEQKAAEAAAARRAQELQDEQRRRMESREDKQWEWANKPVDQLSPKDMLQMQQTQAQIASIMQQMQMRDDANNRAEAGAAAEVAERESAAADKANTQSLIADNIDYLLDPANRDSMERATGPVSNMVPTLRQDTADWENAFEFVKSGLTSEIMDMMTGVLSESDIKMLKSIAAGGIDLRSSPGRIVPTLERFRKALRGEDVSQGVLQSDANTGAPQGVDPADWAVMTPEEQALWN